MSNELVSIRRYAEEARLHSHPFHQIVLPHVGKLQLEVSGRGGYVGPGVAAFIAAGADHTFLAKGDNGFLVVDLPISNYGCEWLADRFDSNAYFSIERPVQGLLDFASTMLERAEASAIVIAQWVALLTHSLAQSRADHPSSELIALNRAMAFMRRHLAEPIQIAMVAAAAGLSSSRLHTLFRKHYSLSPHTTLVQMRVDEARQLLAQTTLSIAEIAVRTGHADQSVLTRRMRLSTGFTPAALRRGARVRPGNT